MPRARNNLKNPDCATNLAPCPPEKELMDMIHPYLIQGMLVRGIQFRLWIDKALKVTEKQIKQAIEKLKGEYVDGYTDVQSFYKQTAWELFRDAKAQRNLKEQREILKLILDHETESLSQKGFTIRIESSVIDEDKL